MSISRASPPDISLHHLASNLVEKKKNKRSRQDLTQGEAADDHNKEHRKRKKYTKLAPAQADATRPTPASIHSHRKQKSKKNQDKTNGVSDGGSATDSVALNSDAVSSNPHASTTALLSTIVAAAAGTPNLHNRADMDPQHHFIDFQYGFNTNPQFTPSQQPLPPFMHAPFSDVTFGSNEDVLRALQDIDMSKIANVLKTLEDAASAANVHLPSLGYLPDPSGASPLGQMPVPSNMIIANTNTTAHSSPVKAVPQQIHPDHAHLLANKWLNPNKLAELVTTKGILRLVYKKGKFSATEEQQIRAAIEGYRVAKELTEDQMIELIHRKNDKSKDNAFWSEITTAVPQRPIISVYHHVRRTYHPLKLQGKWTPEEDGLLTQAVADLGQAWEKVSERVGRMSSDCRDRYRNHILDREIRVKGAWTKEEEEQLTRIVTRMTVEKGKDFDSDVFWSKVSQEMGGRRGRQQCRIKWTDSLSKTVKNDGQKPRWNQQDAYILIHKIDSLEVNDDTEIDWKTLSDPAWNLWSAHILQRRWLTMKRGVPGYENMSHQDIVDTLKSKKGVLLPPPASSRRRKERRVTSAAAIAEVDLLRDTLTESNVANPCDKPGDGWPEHPTIISLSSDSDD